MRHHPREIVDVTVHQLGELGALLFARLIGIIQYTVSCAAVGDKFQHGDTDWSKGPLSD